jgi:hypothetical protein
MGMNFMVPLRAAQLLFALLALGLNAYGTSQCASLSHHCPSSLTLPSGFMVQHRLLLTQQRQLPHLHIDLDHPPSPPLPDHNAALLPHSCAQIWHPGLRSCNYALVVGRFPRRSSVHVSSGVLQRQCLCERQSRSGVQCDELGPVC